MLPYTYVLTITGDLFWAYLFCLELLQQRRNRSTRNGLTQDCKVRHQQTINTSRFGDMLQDELEDTKEVMRIRKSKKNRQNNGQKKKYKRTNNDLQV